MNISIAHRFWVAISAAFLLGSCSGGIGGSGVTDDSGGTGGSGISFGVISGFGSIVVNGVRFDTSNATVVIEGMEQAGKGDLTVLGYPDDKGRVVRVEGTIGGNGSPSTATHVVYNDNVEGPITDNPVDKGNNVKEIIVLGQPVIIDDSTIYQGTSLNTIAMNDIVEVSGLIDNAGVIRASHVEHKGVFVSGVKVDAELKGTVQNLNPPTFQINALTVNYDLADLGDPPLRLVPGQFVEVKGTTDDGSLLTATKIELEDELGADNADEVEVEGFVTGFISVLAFTVGNQLVVTNTDTQFEGGLPEDIAPGVRLEAEGMLVNGILIAGKISFRENIELESHVATVDHGKLTLTLVGMPGITVNVNDVTEIQAAPSDDFGDIQVGNHVTIRARQSAGTVSATRLKEKPDSVSKVVLQGPVDSAVDPNVVILGETVDTTGFDFTHFLGGDETPIGRDTFFNTVQPDDIVKVQGKLLSGAVIWEGVELEDDD